MPATGGGWTTATDHGRLGPASCGDLLRVAKPEPRCLRRRGSITHSRLEGQLHQDWSLGGYSPPQRNPQLKKNEAKQLSGFVLWHANRQTRWLIPVEVSIPEIGRLIAGQIMEVRVP